jgi:hypothetical protein
MKHPRAVLFCEGRAWRLPDGLLARLVFILRFSVAQWTRSQLGAVDVLPVRERRLTFRQRLRRGLISKVPFAPPDDPEDSAAARRAYLRWVFANLDFWAEHPQCSLATLTRMVEAAGIAVFAPHSKREVSSPLVAAGVPAGPTFKAGNASPHWVQPNESDSDRRVPSTPSPAQPGTAVPPAPANSLPGCIYNTTEDGGRQSKPPDRYFDSQAELKIRPTAPVAASSTVAPLHRGGYPTQAHDLPP